MTTRVSNKIRNLVIWGPGELLLIYGTKMYRLCRYILFFGISFDSHVGDASMGTRLLQKYGVDNLGMVGGLVRYQKNVTSVFSVCRWYCHADS